MGTMEVGHLIKVGHLTKCKEGLNFSPGKTFHLWCPLAFFSPIPLTSVLTAPLVLPTA